MATRPTIGQWLRYAYGAGLPEQLSDWVLNDTTSRGWAWRHLTRSLVQIAPVIVLVVVFVPGPPWIRLVAVIAGGAMALLFSLAYMVESNDWRLTKAGYPPGLGEKIRQDRATQAQSRASAERRERAARRSARRA